jgi:hypothetical protein
MSSEDSCCQRQGEHRTPLRLDRLILPGHSGGASVSRRRRDLLGTWVSIRTRRLGGALPDRRRRRGRLRQITAGVTYEKSPKWIRTDELKVRVRTGFAIEPTSVENRISRIRDCDETVAAPATLPTPVIRVNSAPHLQSTQMSSTGSSGSAGQLKYRCWSGGASGHPTTMSQSPAMSGQR